MKSYSNSVVDKRISLKKNHKPTTKALKKTFGTHILTFKTEYKVLQMIIRRAASWPLSLIVIIFAIS